jgi:hypothetical protein
MNDLKDFIEYCKWLDVKKIISIFIWPFIIFMSVLSAVVCIRMAVVVEWPHDSLRFLLSDTEHPLAHIGRVLPCIAGLMAFFFSIGSSVDMFAAERKKDESKPEKTKKKIRKATKEEVKKWKKES